MYVRFKAVSLLIRARGKVEESWWKPEKRDDSHSLAIGGKERGFQTFSETEAAKESASVLESGLWGEFQTPRAEFAQALKLNSFSMFDINCWITLLNRGVPEIKIMFSALQMFRKYRNSLGSPSTYYWRQVKVIQQWAYQFQPPPPPPSLPQPVADKLTVLSVYTTFGHLIW